MIRYATEKYGEDRVSQIITYGTIKAKQAVKDSVPGARLPVLHRRPDHQGHAAAGDGQGHPAGRDLRPGTLALQGGGEFRSLYESDAEVKRVVDTARGLEGLKRQWGVHAAGVILSREPLLDVIPIQRREQDGAIITQFDMGACESLGLLKMDFLGLRNLTVLDDCLINIKANRGVEIVLEDLPLDDPPAYELLARGDTLGRLPARRRPDAGAAALDAADRVRGHLRRARALPARADGRQRPQRVRGPQERPQAGGADPPGAGRAAGGHPRRDLRADRLPGAGHGDRPEGRRLLARQGRPAPPGDGQEEEGDPRQGIRAVLRRHEGERLLRRRDQDAVGHPRPVLRLRVQPRAHRRATAWCRTGRRT